MFAEIKSEIFEKKQIIPNELNDNANGKANGTWANTV